MNINSNQQFYTRCVECGVAEPALKEFVEHSLGPLGNAYTDLSDDYLLQEGKKLNRWGCSPRLPPKIKSFLFEKAKKQGFFKA